MARTDTAPTNHFAVHWVGERYAATRPDHVQLARRVADHTGRVSRVLDIGCGTGLSSRAFTSVADRVVGVDPSRGMLRAAPPDERVTYTLGRAEALPLCDQSVGLAVIGCAFHWCESERFFDETHRVVEPNGWLAIFDTEFLGDATSPALLEWVRERYWKTLPWCPRHPLFDERAHGDPRFALEADLSFESTLPMSLDHVVQFITTQASTIHSIQTAIQTLAEAEARLRTGLAPFFDVPGTGGAARAGGEIAMRFANPVAVLRRQNEG